MLSSIIVLIISAVLFIYWFRYACLLVVGARMGRDFRREVADANNLAFIEARRTLDSESSGVHPELLASLDRDYNVLVYLLRQSLRSESTDFDIEQFLLRLDYRMMRLWCLVAGLYSQTAARRAVLEMTSVLGQLANRMGERTASVQ